MVATFSLPYASSLAVAPTLVGWCPECEGVYDPYPGPGYRCDGDEHRTKSGERRLQKRLMWRCPETDRCDFYFPSRQALIEHEHGQV